MKEFIIKYQVHTDWHSPYNTTTTNSYTEIVSAGSGKEAVDEVLPSFSNPNKSVELISVKAI